MEQVNLVALQLRTCWVVRPADCVGMMGWGNKPWEAKFFKTHAQAQRYIKAQAQAWPNTYTNHSARYVVTNSPNNDSR